MTTLRSFAEKQKEDHRGFLCHLASLERDEGSTVYKSFMTLQALKLVTAVLPNLAKMESLSRLDKDRQRKFIVNP